MTGEGYTNLDQLPLEADYRTGRKDPAEFFYRPCLRSSAFYDRAVGYFRSSIYLIVGNETIEFAKRGGKIRLICSPSLEEQDISSIGEAYKKREEIISKSLEADIERLVSNPNTEYRTRVLGTLIAVGAMDIRIALPPSSKGIYHEKIGVFTDTESNHVSFIGSANETWNAWHLQGNFESIEVFCSWKDPSELARVNRHKADFNDLWLGITPGISVFDFPKAAKESLFRISVPSLSEIIPTSLTIPTVSGKQLQGHQLTAISEWEKNNKRGILEHATGSGKTITAISAIRNHILNGLPALVLVPSQLLLFQWRLELQSEVPFASLLCAGAGFTDWKKSRKIESMSSGDNSLGPRVILATMQTAASNSFRSRIDQGAHLLFVADEVHQIGSPSNSSVLNIQSGPRLGLSATPYRYGDPNGTSTIFSYFGPIVEPKVTLHDAIRSGRLVEYEYYPHPIHLNQTESDEWKKISYRIKLETAKSKKEEGGNSVVSEKIKLLLIQRSRIAKKARLKVPTCIDILSSTFESGDRWLVYCEDQEQLNEVLDGLKGIGLSPLEYHSSMDGDKEATLDWFKNIGGILVSIRCLDEGIDIPSIDHAVIMASSQNPRQFIQRRGRVLRRAERKTMATIHDLIVVPHSLENEPEQLSLLKSELLRAIEFSNSALNRFAGVELRSIAHSLGFDPDILITDGVEEDE